MHVLFITNGKNGFIITINKGRRVTSAQLPPYLLKIF